MNGSTRQVARIVGGDTEEHLKQYVSELEFRSYQDNVNRLHVQGVLRCEEDIPQEEMVENILSMTESLKGDISQPLLQQLQLARQLESLSKSRDEHILNTAKWLVDDEMVPLRMSTWREIVRVGWIVHHYPVRENISLLPQFEETCFLTPWTVLKQALLPWNYDKLA